MIFFPDVTLVCSLKNVNVQKNSVNENLNNSKRNVILNVHQCETT